MTETTASPRGPGVYRAISRVAMAIAEQGIAKARKNQQQGYAFRGVDDIYNALAPLLASSGLVILPRVLSRELTERDTAKGGTLFNVVVEVEFDFVAAEDGSTHTVKTFGEAMDSGDKATNKAMSAAYKYACMQTFCIPTEGDNDADATTHTVAPRPAPARQPNGAPRPQAPPVQRNGNGNGNSAPPAAAQPQLTQLVTSARSRLLAAGITKDGSSVMFAELGAQTLLELPAPVLERLATAGPTAEEISRWNGPRVTATAA